MSRRLLVTGVAAAAVLGAVIPSFASSVGSPVTVDTSNGVAVGVHNGNTPIAAASVTPDGQACVGISLQLPVCTPGGIIGGIQTTIPQQEGPVTLDTSNGGVAVGVHLGSTPVAGASVSKNGQACVGISLQVPVCTPGITSTQSNRASTAQQLPVTIRHDDNGTAVGVDNVGVVIYPDGTVCPVVSTQAWRCVPTS